MIIKSTLKHIQWSVKSCRSRNRWRIRRSRSAKNQTTWMFVHDFLLHTSFFPHPSFVTLSRMSTGQCFSQHDLSVVFNSNFSAPAHVYPLLQGLWDWSQLGRSHTSHSPVSPHAHTTPWRLTLHTHTHEHWALSSEECRSSWEAYRELIVLQMMMISQMTVWGGRFWGNPSHHNQNTSMERRNLHPKWNETA
jgi:hypothetical protein